MVMWSDWFVIQPYLPNWRFRKNLRNLGKSMAGEDFSRCWQPGYGVSPHGGGAWPWGHESWAPGGNTSERVFSSED